AGYNIPGVAQKSAPGVYVQDAKICSLGLRVRHGRTYHGLSLNVAMDLDPFSHINPCGYAGMQVTQIDNFMPGIKVVDVIQRLVPILQNNIGYVGVEW
ncbi:MAG TPA: lipoyl(octanoyl) transferase LipB, partial [Gammaproteobacteria bacterium]|nr:lipoyl(octanoyl) transferase LipB [Gammaproteobacteria bacterium]